VLDDSIVEDIHRDLVETEKGLVVPVARHADRLSLAGLAQARGSRDAGARSGSRPTSSRAAPSISTPPHGNLYGFAIFGWRWLACAWARS
jgi:hypothetical protein